MFIIEFFIATNNAEITKKNENTLTWLHWYIIMLYETDENQKKTDIVGMVLKGKNQKRKSPSPCNDAFMDDGYPLGHNSI